MPDAYLDEVATNTTLRTYTSHNTDEGGGITIALSAAENEDDFHSTALYYFLNRMEVFDLIDDLTAWLEETAG